LLLASYVITFPSHLGFSYSSTTSTCTEVPATIVTSNYISRAPSCTFSTVNSNVLLTVTNLRVTGSTKPSYYGLYFSGLTTGPAALENYLNGVSSTGTFVSIYLGSTVASTVYCADYFFEPVTVSSGVTLTGYPP